MLYECRGKFWKNGIGIIAKENEFNENALLKRVVGGYSGTQSKFITRCIWSRAIVMTIHYDDIYSDRT